MALPVTISGSAFPAQNYFAGPFKAPNQQIYLVLLESTGSTPEVYMATDPTSSFAAQDAASNPVAAPTSMWPYMSGSEIHIATASGSGVEIQYHVFDTASDTWTTIDETIENVKNAPASGDLSCSIGVRSDGDKIVLYNGDTDADMGSPFERVDYARKEGSTWTVGIDVGGISPIAQDRIGSVIVRGSVDSMHLFWTRNPGAGPRPRARTLNAANSLSTIRISTTLTSAHGFTPGMHFLDGTTERVIIPFRNRSSDAPYVWRFTESIGDLAAPAGETQVSDGTNDVDVQNSTPVMCLAVDGDGEAYLMWSHDVNLDLFRDNLGPPYSTVNWGTDVEEIDATTINRISCNVYPRDGAIKLAFVYDEAGTIKYNEVSISAPTAPTMANSRFPDQNLKIGPYSI